MNDLKCIGRHMFLVALLVLMAHPANLAAGSTGEVPRIAVADVEKLLDNPDVVIIDVRKKKAWWSSTTKIFGAVREDPLDVSQWVDKYPKTKTLIVYCDWKKERTSARVAQLLINKGYKNVYAIKGGWKAWRKAGYIIEKK